MRLADHHQLGWIVNMAIRTGVRLCPVGLLPQFRSDGRHMTPAEQRLTAIQLADGGHVPNDFRRAILKEFAQPRMMEWLNERTPGAFHYSDELLASIKADEADYLIGRLILELDELLLNESRRGYVDAERYV